MSRRIVADHTRRNRVSAREESPPRDVKLPPYQRPAFTMSEPVRLEIGSLASNASADTKKYDHHLRLSAKMLRASVGRVNDRLYLRRNLVEERAAKRRARGLADKSELDRRLEDVLAALEDEIPSLSEQIEAAVRDVIDRQHDLDNSRAALREAAAAVRNQPLPPSAAEVDRQRPGAAERVRFEDVEDADEFLAGQRAAADDDEDEGAVVGEDDEENEEEASGRRGADRRRRGGGLVPPGPLNLFDKARVEKIAQYKAIEPFQKYALNNDYVSFKRSWYEALNPDNERGMPDATTWFRPDGRPVLLSRRAAAANGEGDGDGDGDGDDDLVIAREKESFLCPITRLLMQEPYTSAKCGHTFERAAVVAHFQSLPRPARGPKQSACPMGGCEASLQLDDFSLDGHVLRKIERMQARERNRAEEEDEDEDMDLDVTEGHDSSVVETRARSTRPGRPTNLKQERRSLA